MPIPSKVAKGVFLIDTQALGEKQVVAAYFVVGRKCALIDMGYMSSTGTILRELEELGVSEIDYLLPTHVHLDHCGSCSSLAKAFRKACVLAHPIGRRHLIDPSRLVAGTTQLFGKELVERYGHPGPIDESRVQDIGDLERIDLGEGIVLRSLWTPGHAPHHLSYTLDGTSLMFTGDAVAVLFPGTPVLVPTSPPPSFDLGQMLKSLRRIERIGPKVLCTPHFGVNLKGAEFLQRNIEKLHEWEERISLAKRRGYAFDALAAEMVSEVSSSAGYAPLPEYLRVLTKISVMGFFEYVDKQRGKGMSAA